VQVGPVPHSHYKIMGPPSPSQAPPTPLQVAIGPPDPNVRECGGPIATGRPDPNVPERGGLIVGFFFVNRLTY